LERTHHVDVRDSEEKIHVLAFTKNLHNPQGFYCSTDPQYNCIDTNRSLLVSRIWFLSEAGVHEGGGVYQKLVVSDDTTWKVVVVPPPLFCALNFWSLFLHLSWRKRRRGLFHQKSVFFHSPSFSSLSIERQHRFRSLTKGNILPLRCYPHLHNLRIVQLMTIFE